MYLNKYDIPYLCAYIWSVKEVLKDGICLVISWESVTFAVGDDRCRAWTGGYNIRVSVYGMNVNDVLKGMNNLFIWDIIITFALWK